MTTRTIHRAKWNGVRSCGWRALPPPLKSHTFLPAGGPKSRRRRSLGLNRDLMTCNAIGWAMDLMRGTWTRCGFSVPHGALVDVSEG